MADTIRDVVIRLTIQQQDFRAKGLDLGELKKSLDEREKLFENSAKKINDVLNKPHTAAGVVPTAQFDELAKKAADLEAKLAGLKNKTTDFGGQSKVSMIGAADAFRTAGEGAFTLARGVAFLASDSDESFREMLQNVARVQGSFDLFKGGVDTVKGLTQAVRNLGGTSAILQRVGTLAMGVFTPWGAAITAVTIGLGAAAAAMHTFGSETEMQVRRLDKLIDPLGELSVRMDAMSRVDRSRGSLHGLMELSPTQRLSSLTAREHSSQAAFESEQSLFRQQMTLQAQGLADWAMGPGAGKHLGAEGSLTLARNLDPFFSLEEQIGTLENQLRLQERLAEIEREKVLAARDAVREYESQRKAAESMLQTTRQLIEAEKNRIAGNEAALGRLSTEDFMSLDNIAKKVGGGGQITRTEAQFLQGTGLDFAADAAQQYFQGVGRQRGMSEIARAFGSNSRLPQLEAQEQQFHAAVERAEEMGTRFKRQADEFFNRLAAIINEALANNIEGRLEGLKQELEARRQEQRNN